MICDAGGDEDNGEAVGLGVGCFEASELFIIQFRVLADDKCRCDSHILTMGEAYFYGITTNTFHLRHRHTTGVIEYLYVIHVYLNIHVRKCFNKRFLSRKPDR